MMITLGDLRAVLPALEPYISLLAYPMASTVRDLGVTERTTFKIVNLGFWILVYGMVSGLIFGLPLGYLVRPHWLRNQGAVILRQILRSGIEKIIRPDQTVGK